MFEIVRRPAVEADQDDMFCQRLFLRLHRKCQGKTKCDKKAVAFHGFYCWINLSLAEASLSQRTHMMMELTKYTMYISARASVTSREVRKR